MAETVGTQLILPPLLRLAKVDRLLRRRCQVNRRRRKYPMATSHLLWQRVVDNAFHLLFATPDMKRVGEYYVAHEVVIRTIPDV